MKEDDKSKAVTQRWNDDLLQMDKPLNKVPLLSVVNYSTLDDKDLKYMGFSTSLSISQILSDTPVGKLGGIEMKVANRHGHIVLDQENEESSPTLESQLKIINNWVLDHKSSLIMLSIGNLDVDKETQSEVSKLISSSLRDKIYTKELLLEDFREGRYKNSDGSARWPSADELNDRGFQILVLSEGLDDALGDTIPANFILNKYHASQSKDILPESMLMKYFSSPSTVIIEGRTKVSDQSKETSMMLDCANVDQLILSDGIISLQHVTSNDQRIIPPMLRGQASLREGKISLLDSSVNTQSPKYTPTSSLLSSLLSAIGAEAMSFASLAYKSYLNYLFIKNAEQNLVEEIKHITPGEILAYRKGELLEKKITPEETKAYLKRKMSKKILIDTIEAGASTTTGSASGLLSFGIVFPPLFPLLVTIGVIMIAIGFLATGIVAYVSNKVLSKKIDKLLEKHTDNIYSLSRSFTLTEIEFDKERKRHKEIRILNRVVSGALGASLFLQIGNMAKFIVKVFSKIFGTMIGFANSIMGALDSALNFKQRRAKLQNLQQYIIDSSLIDIDSKKFYLFGPRKITEFIQSHKDKIFEKYKIDPSLKSLSFEKLYKYLDSNPSIYSSIRQDAIAFYFDKDIKEFCKKMGLKFDLNDNNILKSYLQNKVLKAVDNDIWTSSIINSVKITSAIAITGSIIAPPLVPFFWIGAAASMIVSTIVTKIIGNKEKELFKGKTEELFNNIYSSENKDNENPLFSRSISYLNSIKKALQLSNSEFLPTDTHSRRKSHSARRGLIKFPTVKKSKKIPVSPTIESQKPKSKIAREY